MFVKYKDLDGYNSPLAIKRYIQRSEMIMSYSSPKEIPYFDFFRFTL